MIPGCKGGMGGAGGAGGGGVIIAASLPSLPSLSSPLFLPGNVATVVCSSTLSFFFDRTRSSVLSPGWWPTLRLSVVLVLALLGCRRDGDPESFSSPPLFSTRSSVLFPGLCPILRVSFSVMFTLSLLVVFR